MSEVWRECGYANFADGTFGNGGQNIYVSRAGVLQRIFHFDFNRDGYVDLLFVNSQDMDERPPAYVYGRPLGEVALTELPTLGTYDGAVGDLNGDGYDDLVLANQCNGTHTDVTAYIYYGSERGLSERRKIELPAPNSRAVAIGDFNGDGRLDLAFASDGKLRLFYQTAAGFMPGQFTDVELTVTHLAAGDLDGDGCADLYCRSAGSAPVVLWGGPDGIKPQRRTLVGGVDDAIDEMPSSTPAWMPYHEGWKPKILLIHGRPHLFRPESEQACFIPVSSDRGLGEPLRIPCADVVSAAVGDVNGDGRDDLVLVAQRRELNRETPWGVPASKTESSWIYWGTEDGFDPSQRTAIPSLVGRDVAVGDLNGNGYADVVLCQGRTDVLNTTESLIFRGRPEGVDPEPVRLVSHDAATALIARTNDDAHPQVIMVNHCGGRVRGDMAAYIYYNGPEGFDVDRRAELPCWAAPDALCCDFNDDGWADILISNCSENAPHLDPGSFVYWGGPDGFSTDRKKILPAIRAHGSAAGDFRHTGCIDVATVGFSNAELTIFRGGPGGFDTEDPQRIVLDDSLCDYTTPRQPQLYGSSGSEWREPRWLLAADLNNNGWLDLVVSQCIGPQCLILWGGPDGFSRQRCTLLNVEGGICAQAADLTGNGWLDLIIGGHQAMSKQWKHDSYVYIYWGGPDGFAEDRRAQVPAHTCNSLTIADFNRDGILDIFATSYNAGRDRDCDSYIYWGTPEGVYSAESRTRLFTHSACGCVAADYNEDGWIDLAIASHKTYGNHVGLSQLWWNGPEGFSSQRVSHFPTTGPHGMLPIDPGNIMDRGPNEYYISSPFKLPDSACVMRIRWDAETPPKTWVKAQIRSAPEPQSLPQAPWQGPHGLDGWFENAQPAEPGRHAGRWIQYRLALGAVNGGSSPRVTCVEVEYE